MYLQKVISKKTLNKIFYWDRSTDPDLWIRTKMSRIHKTAFSPQLPA